MRRWMVHLLAALLGCAVAVLAAAPLRAALSPWRAIGADKIVMFAADQCKVSGRAIALVAGDPRLREFIVPVPALGPEVAAPKVCAAALQVLGEHSARVRWLPDGLACRWLTEDAFAVVPEGGVATPSWYFAGEFVGEAMSASEAALFNQRGWRIEWMAAGLRLSPLDEPPPPPEVLTVQKIEDLGLSSYRDDRW